MYPTKDICDYLKVGEYTIMPPGLPDRFYPRDPNKVHKTKNYVICFNIDINKEKKQQFIKDYAEYYKKEKQLGVFR